MTDTPAKKRRGPPPQDPAHGALSPTERSARHRKQLAQQAQQAVNVPSEAHTLPLPALMHALQGQLAKIEADTTASRHPAAALVAALVRKYRLPVTESEIEWDFSINEARLAQITA